MFVSCNNGQLRNFPKEITTIDIAAAFENPIDDLNQFIDSCWYVILETPAQAMQGHITKVVYYDAKVYTLDEFQSKTLNVYNSSGAYLYSLAQRGQGPNEALNITDFSISGNEVFVSDILRKRIQVFSTGDGKHIRSVELPFASDEFAKINDNRYLFMLSPYNEDAGKEYMENEMLITDSLLKPLKFQITRPSADYQEVSRSQWNRLTNNRFLFSIFSESIYQYNYDADSMNCVAGIEYGGGNIPDDLRNNYRAYMDYYADRNPISLMDDSPIVCGKYIVGQVKDGRSKYLMINDGVQTYVKQLNQNNYNVSEPLFPIGSTEDGVLISYIEPTVGIPLLIENKTVINGVIVTENTSAVLLFSKLK